MNIDHLMENYDMANLKTRTIYAFGLSIDQLFREFDQTIQELINDGWEHQGGIAITSRPSVNGNPVNQIILAQTLVLEEEEIQF